MGGDEHKRSTGEGLGSGKISCFRLHLAQARAGLVVLYARQRKRTEGINGCLLPSVSWFHGR